MYSQIYYVILSIQRGNLELSQAQRKAFGVCRLLHSCGHQRKCSRHKPSEVVVLAEPRSIILRRKTSGTIMANPPPLKIMLMKL